MLHRFYMSRINQALASTEVQMPLYYISVRYRQVNFIEHSSIKYRGKEDYGLAVTET